MTLAADNWEGLLKSATVAIRGRLAGTGFVVAPGLVVTCAHVVARSADSLPDRLDAQVVSLNLRLTLEPVPKSYVRDRESGLDLVVLRIVGEGADRVRPVLMSDALAIGDALWAYGHPADSSFSAGQSTTSRYEGADLRSTRPGAPELPRAWGTPVGGGFSGSGVINRRTGAVCGMLCTSDHAGSAHMIPVSEILSRCPQAEGNQNLRGDWLSSLTDDQIAAGGWSFPRPLLRKYLTLAAKAADKQPYPVLKDVDAAIPLSSVFVRRQASAVVRDKKPVQAGAPSDTSVPDQVRLPAEVLFGLDEDVVLVGAPGSGKSSLLRAAVRELAGRWEQKDWAALVPVRVHALDLDRESDGLAVALASGLGIELAEEWNPAEPWPVAWFARPPAPGARWLIMVDGLDEITDPERRKDVLRRIRTMRENDPQRRVYVCLVATRPLPDSELLTSWGRRFELMPLEPGDLVGFAEKWFTALGVDDWGPSAERFIAELRAAGMTDPARNPLMASMLCQLYSLNRDAALPEGRAAAYRAFVQHVHDRAPARRGSGLKQQINATLKDSRHSPDVEKAVGYLPSRFPELLRKLALARHDGDRSSAVDLLTRWTSDGLRPTRTSEQEWDKLMRGLIPELLRTSGLLVEDDSGFAFVHLTFGEFLTAQAIAADARRSKAEFQRVFGVPLPAVAWGGAWIGVTTPGADSLTRFLVEAWNAQHQPQLSRVLKQIAPMTDGAKFIATVVADGARLDDAVRKSAAETLYRVASRGDLDAAASLARMGDHRGGDILYDRARSSGERPPKRIAAAQTLADLGDPRGIEALHTMATTYPEPAMEAAEELARRGDERGADLVRRAIRDPRTDTDRLLKAVAAAARLGSQPIPEELVARAFDRQCPYDERIAVAQYLDGLSDARGAEALTDMVRNPPPGADAQKALQALGDKYSYPMRPSDHSRDALRALATAPGLPMTLRVKAAWRVQEVWREQDLLLSAAEDSRVPPKERLAIIRRLLPDGRTAAIAGTLARDRRATPQVRLEAAQFLASGDYPQEVVSLLREAGLLPEMRMTLLLATPPLYDFGNDPRWMDAMVASIHDGSLPVSRRRDLIDRLAHVEAGKGKGWRPSDPLSSLAAAHGLPGSLRLHAARVGRKRSGLGIYSKLFLDPSLEPRFRITASVTALAELVALLAVAVATAVGRLVSDLVMIVRVLIIAGLPLCAAIAAVALGEAHRADSPPEDWKQGAYTALTATLLGVVFRAAARRGRRFPATVSRLDVLAAVGLAAGACFYGLSHPEALHGWAPAACAGAAALAPASVSMSPRSTGRERTVSRGFGGRRTSTVHTTPRGWSNPVNSARLALAVLTAGLAWFAATRPESLGVLADLGTWLAAEVPWSGQTTVSW
ncbi:trypsin-like peptidase domain-containing protein [Streptomyces sp. NPDC046727]|uniref:trypsin-like peptidase domain-containing protein n=1 Tax=Streptomyces sp. NPDC046727 TaxID=3155373 RepID=UPI0033C355FB